MLLTGFVGLVLLLVGFAAGAVIANEWQAGERERLRSANQVLRAQLDEERGIRLTPELADAWRSVQAHDLQTGQPWSDEYLDELWPGGR